MITCRVISPLMWSTTSVYRT